jgi:hypothetical protein
VRDFACSGGGDRDEDGPPIPAIVQVLIRQMARDNLTWSQERIANELFW